MMHNHIDTALNLIAQEIGESTDLVGNTRLEFKDVGLDRLLSKSILSRLYLETGLRLPADIFESCADVGSLIKFLQAASHCDASRPVTKASASSHDASSAIDEDDGCTSSRGSPTAVGQLLPDQPLSIRLQNFPRASGRTIFLLPDGSGSGMSYAYIPVLGPGICVYALNSPFLTRPWDFTSMPDVVQRWAEEIRRIQPKGSYILGGWSAGGYYAFEVAKYLMSKLREDNGRPVEVEKIILIDSPCRLEYEALPMEVVSTLSREGLIGCWGAAKSETPKWLLDHFAATIGRVQDYQPTPLNMFPESQQVPPHVFIIWSTDSICPTGAAVAVHGLLSNPKVTHFILEPRSDFGPQGWEKLFPAGSQISISKTTGTHFSLMFPPNVSEPICTLMKL